MSGLVERLLQQAENVSEARKMAAQAKSLRQGHNPPRDDLYSWTGPEQTLEAQAAARITALEAEVERLRERLSQAAEYINRPEPAPYVGPNQALGGPHDAD